MKVKLLLKYINSFTAPAYILLKVSLIISILLMALAAAIMLVAGDCHTYTELAKKLFAAPQSVLLIGGLFSAVIEDISS